MTDTPNTTNPSTPNPPGFEDRELLTREHAQGEFDDLTRDCFEHLETSLGRAIGDLAMDVGSGNETAELLQAKVTSIVEELVCRYAASVLSGTDPATDLPRPVP